MLTLRDGTDDALFGRIQRVLPKIEQKMELQRQEREARQAAKANRQTTAETEGYCYLHEVQMKRSKQGDGWFHKAGEQEDGKAIWCRGK